MEDRAKYLARMSRANNSEKGRARLLRYCISPTGIKTRRESAWRRVGIVGATYNQYIDLTLQQSGLCAICSGPPGKRPLHWDHCHITGRPRGLLCSSCNLALGRLEGSDWLQRASNYLARWSQ